MPRRRDGLVAACDDPRLLGIDLWPTQRRLLGSIEKGPRLSVWALGRRSGKSTMAAVACLWDALLRPHLAERLRPGEQRYAVAVATNLRQARLIVRAAHSIVERSPLLAGLVSNVTDDEIAFTTGATVAAFPCTSRGGRGWPISLLVMDEAAHFVDTDGNSAAEPVWRALAPSVAQFGTDARVIVSSTPFGSDGFFAELFQRVESGELGDAVAHHSTTAAANPTIDADFLSVEEARDPEGFRGEYLAQFVGGGASFLDPERIAEAVADRGELAPGYALDWVAGLDPAFSSDPFGLALVGRDPRDRQRLVLGLARAWKPSRRKAASFGSRSSTPEGDEVGRVTAPWTPDAIARAVPRPGGNRLGYVAVTCPRCGEEIDTYGGRPSRPHSCAECGECLPGRRRRDRIFCSGRCRMRALRRRRSGT